MDIVRQSCPGYKAKLISTIVDLKDNSLPFDGYKAKLISTIVDNKGEEFCQVRAIKPN